MKQLSSNRLCPAALGNAPALTLPNWLPIPVRLYLHHTEEGQSLRALARHMGVNASTILRQVRRYETRREDPLVDAALEALRATENLAAEGGVEVPRHHHSAGSASALARRALERRSAQIGDLPSEAELMREGKRILRRLAEPGAVLAFAPEMEKAVVIRDYPDGRSVRTAILERRVAQAFSLKDWLNCRKLGRVNTYELSTLGRQALRDMLLKDDEGFGEALQDYEGQALPEVFDPAGKAENDAQGTRKIRMNLSETPISILARRVERDGKRFLSPELVQAADRLREDYELGQFPPQVAQNWERLMRVDDQGNLAPAVQAARLRLIAALSDLGAGLGDVALRVCCLLEGVEATEKRMGWAARSGKIVLRIALQRLRRHYDLHYGRTGPLIGG